MTWFLAVSPGWFQTMKMDFVAGRDFRWDDEYPKVAIVNETFVTRYFGEQNPVGRSFDAMSVGGAAVSADTPGKPHRVTLRIIGVVRDARYEDLRLPLPATAYIP